MLDRFSHSGNFDGLLSTRLVIELAEIETNEDFLLDYDQIICNCKYKLIVYVYHPYQISHHDNTIYLLNL